MALRQIQYTRWMPPHQPIDTARGTYPYRQWLTEQMWRLLTPQRHRGSVKAGIRRSVQDGQLLIALFGEDR